MRPVTKSLQEYGRGIAGGLMFSIPMLYTMEMWWTGFVVQPESLLVFLGGTFLILLGYNRFAGMHRDIHFKHVVIDSVEELGLGLVLSFFILWMLGRIAPGEMYHREVIGKVTVEAMMVAIGISVGTAQLGGDKEGKSDVELKGDEDDEPGDKRKYNGWLSHGVLSLCGAVLISGSVAPTDEITMIAVGISNLQAFILGLFTLSIIILIMFYIDFANSNPVEGDNKFFRIFGAGFYSYAVGLIAGALLLAFFGHFDDNSFNNCMKMLVVLGVAGGLGASAGRFLLKG